MNWLHIPERMLHPNLRLFVQEHRTIQRDEGMPMTKNIILFSIKVLLPNKFNFTRKINNQGIDIQNQSEKITIKVKCRLETNRYIIHSIPV